MPDYGYIYFSLRVLDGIKRLYDYHEYIKTQRIFAAKVAEVLKKNREQVSGGDDGDRGPYGGGTGPKFH